MTRRLVMNPFCSKNSGEYPRSNSAPSPLAPFPIQPAVTPVDGLVRGASPPALRLANGETVQSAPAAAGTRSVQATVNAMSVFIIGYLAPGNGHPTYGKPSGNAF